MFTGSVPLRVSGGSPRDSNIARTPPTGGPLVDQDVQSGDANPAK